MGAVRFMARRAHRLSTSLVITHAGWRQLVTEIKWELHDQWNFTVIALQQLGRWRRNGAAQAPTRCGDSRFGRCRVILFKIAFRRHTRPNNARIFTKSSHNPAARSALPNICAQLAELEFNVLELPLTFRRTCNLV